MSVWALQWRVSHQARSHSTQLHRACGHTQIHGLALDTFSGWTKPTLTFHCLLLECWWMSHSQVSHPPALASEMAQNWQRHWAPMCSVTRRCLWWRDPLGSPFDSCCMVATSDWHWCSSVSRKCLTHSPRIGKVSGGLGFSAVSGRLGGAFLTLGEMSHFDTHRCSWSQS